MKTLLITALLTCALTGFRFSDFRTITGKVTTSHDGTAILGVTVVLKGTKTSAFSGVDGKYSIKVPQTGGVLVFSFVGFVTREVRIGKGDVINVVLDPDVRELEEIVVTGSGKIQRKDRVQMKQHMPAPAPGLQGRTPGVVIYDQVYSVPADTEDYEGIEEDFFRSAIDKPLSTFSIDVDAASYSNIRRFINNGQRPPADAVRIEEMINYFDYDYEGPAGEHPFRVHSAISYAPWNSKHHLVRIGLQGKTISEDKLPPSNLVFLVDVSGSMDQANKLPLVISSFKMLAGKLRPQDYVSIVVYAGAAGVVLEPTPGDEKQKIIEAVENLRAGGSTAGAAGLRTAYALAKKHFKQNGNNRIILATDGDFNVGESSNEAMEKLVEQKRKEGVFLTVLGYGMGNLKDSKMEILADKGNGNYAYIDNLPEAHRVLVTEFGGTLFTIASDVKIQVEFNPAKVHAYRLIGYENRRLKDEDFNNDRKDAGELGSGHSVTALYEVIPAGVRSDYFSIDKLKYQSAPAVSAASGDWLTVKLRYKQPGADESRLLEQVLSGSPSSLRQADDQFRWAASVAAFGMFLKDSEYLNNWPQQDMVSFARSARSRDVEGYRAEMIRMMEACPAEATGRR